MSLNYQLRRELDSIVDSVVTSGLSSGSAATALNWMRQEVPQMTPSKKRKMKNVDVEMRNDEGEGAENAAEAIHAVTHGHHKRGVSIKKKRHIKISRGFKKIVEEAMKPEMMSGFKIDFYNPIIRVAIPANTQGVDNWGYFNATQTPYGSDSTAGGMGWSFLPEYFLDAASVLFNGKGATSNAWLFNNTSNIGASDLPASASGNAAKFRVINSYETFLWKNVTNRVVDMKIYLCAPKAVGYLTTAPLTNSGGIAAEADAIRNPAVTWTNSLADEGVAGVNLGPVTVSTLGSKPQYSREWQKYFKVETHDVVLEPGESFCYKVQGPNDLQWDAVKHFKNNVFANIQKYSRYVMTAIKMDIGVDAIGGQRLHFTPANTIDPATAQNVVCERKLYTSIEMPQETGFSMPTVLPATATPTPLGYRRSPYIVSHWNQADAAVGVVMEKQTETRQATS